MAFSVCKSCTSFMPKFFRKEICGDSFIKNTALAETFGLEIQNKECSHENKKYKCWKNTCIQNDNCCLKCLVKFHYECSEFVNEENWKLEITKNKSETKESNREIKECQYQTPNSCVLIMVAQKMPNHDLNIFLNFTKTAMSNLLSQSSVSN